ncbi:hypothetical protein [Acetobacter sp.]|uniref:hypothetical protein n=1 Tax=Acetobacter sp. TaxID=440 RepID=UPI00258360ED|nr:hypothetical protein [Acetobacter sp.]MCC6103800.1 hypothetical protein [Acetobacter sp.]
MKNILHALRLYATPIFWRENYTLLTGLLWTGVALFIAFTDHSATHWQNGLFKLPQSFGTWWWLGLQAAITGVACQYWRQVRSPLASMTPGMIEAEYGAALLVLAAVVLFLAVPLLRLGAPFLNVLAQEAICLALGVSGDMTGPKNLRKPVRWLRMFMVFVLFVAFMFPQAQERILSAPWYVAAGLLAVGLALTVIELSHRPQPVALPGGDALTAASTSYENRRKVLQAAKARFPASRPQGGLAERGFVAEGAYGAGYGGGASPAIQSGAIKPSSDVQAGSGIMRLMQWQFPWLRKPPVPNTMVTPGPAGFLASSVVVLIALFIMNVVFEAFQTGGMLHWAAIRKSMLMAPQMICMISANGLASWMLVRADWPFLLNLAGYGTRADFARALYTTHAKRAVQTAALAALFCAPLGIAFGAEKWAELPLCMGAIFSVMVGASYLPSLPLLFTRQTRPGVIHVFNLLGSFVCVQLGVTLLFTEHSLPEWLWGLLFVGLPFSAIMAWLAPRALARVDWPIEPLAAP